MFGVTKRKLLMFAIPIVAILGISQTGIPSGGLDILNSAGTAVISLFDTGDADFSGDVTANAFIGDGSGLTGVSGGTGHTIKEDGTPLTARAGLNFIGPTVTATDNAGASSTDVTINAVAGPGSSVDNTIPRFDSTTGKLIQASGVTLDDSNNLGGIAALTADNLDLTTVLAVVEGGTGVGTLTDAGVVIGNGSGVLQATSAGTAGQVLTSNGTGVDPTFQSFPGGGDALTTNPLDQFADTTSSGLAGIITNETGTGLLVYSTSPSFTTPNLGTPSAVVLTNATGLPVAGGGTGATTFNDAGVLIGNSTGAIQSTGAGTSGQVLTSNGAGVDPTFQTPSGSGSGDLVGPDSATDNAIVRYDGTTGKLVENSAVTIADTTGDITTSGTVDGRDVSVDGAKLDGIESSATADQSNAEIETAYNSQVAAASQVEMEAGSETAIRRMSPLRVKQAIDALAPAGAVDSVNGQTGTVSLDADDIDDTSTTNKWTTAGRNTKVDHLTVTQGVDLDTLESNVATNNAKTSNATHTGQVTGATSLTVDKSAITGQTDAAPATGDSILFSDVSDSGNLKEGLVSQILGLITGLTVGQGGTGASTLTDNGVIVGNGTGALQATGAGTAGQVLTSNGAGSDPTFQAAASGGDPTYGSDAGATDDAVYVDAGNEVGIGTTTPAAPLHIYSTTSAPRVMMQYATGGATDSGWKSAGTVVSVTSSNPGWTSATNAQGAPDGVAASIVLGELEFGEILRASNFPDFGVPSGAVVTGVETRIVYKNSNGDAQEYINQLVIAGTPSGDNNAAGSVSYSSTYINRDRGSSSDLWGLSLTDGSFGSTFGFQFQIDDEYGNGVTFYVDAMQVKVHYTETVDQTWSAGIDITDGAYTVAYDTTDWLRINLTTGAVEFPGVIDVDGIKQDGVLYDLSTFSTSGGDVDGPASAVDNAMARYDGTTGKLLQGSEPTVSDTGSITMGSGDTVDGRDLSVDGTALDTAVTKLAGIETGATADQSNAEIETAYNAQVGAASQVEMEAGTETAIRRMSPLRVKQAIAALAGGGDVDGPIGGVSTDNALALWDGTDGRKIKNSLITLVGGTDLWGDDLTIKGLDIPAAGTALVSDSANQTLSNKRLTPTAGADNSTPVDVNYDSFQWVTTALAANTTINAPTGTPVQGEQLLYWINQGAGPYTVTWNSVFKASAEWGTVSNAIPVVSTTNDAWDYYLFVYNSAEGEWHLLALSQGN